MSDISFVSQAPGHRPAPRRWPRRMLRAAAVLLIVVGVLTLLDAVVTLVWQEPFTALYATIRQDQERGAVSRLERAPPTAAEARTLASLSDERARVAYLARELQHHSHDGSPIGRIEIPRIGASFVLINGTNTDDLKGGPGLYPETSFPGIPGTTAIAGHRTTYLAPFRNINDLVPGSRIVLRMPYAELVYRVTRQLVVAPTDVEAAVGHVGYDRLVLSACTPLFSAAKRLLVYARLAVTVPEGAARWLPGGVLSRPIPNGPTRPAPEPRLPPVLESLQQQGPATPV